MHWSLRLTAGALVAVILAACGRSLDAPPIEAKPTASQSPSATSPSAAGSVSAAPSASGDAGAPPLAVPPPTPGIYDVKADVRDDSCHLGYPKTIPTRDAVSVRLVPGSDVQPVWVTLTAPILSHRGYELNGFPEATFGVTNFHGCVGLNERVVVTFLRLTSAGFDLDVHVTWERPKDCRAQGAQIPNASCTYRDLRHYSLVRACAAPCQVMVEKSTCECP